MSIKDIALMVLGIGFVSLLGLNFMLKKDLKASELALAIEKANTNDLRSALNKQNEALEALRVDSTSLNSDYHKAEADFAFFKAIEPTKCEQKIRAINDILQKF